jgi:antitoxin MazE
MLMRVEKWGRSLAIRLPAAVVKALSLREGDEIVIRVAGARQFAAGTQARRKKLLKRLRAFRGRLPADAKFDRHETTDT